MSIFIPTVQGVWNFAKPTQMLLRSEAGPRRTPLFTVSYWALVIPVRNTILQEHDCSGQWKGAETGTVI